MQKKILVVDDDELVLYGLEKALRAEGVVVTTAGTASEAVLKIASCPYDLCLLDVKLPDFSGLVLMKIIREICPKVKVIIMTANYIDSHDLSDNLKEALQDNACHFIPKPFNLFELKNIVVQALHADDSFHAGFQFSGDRFFARKMRKKERVPFSDEIRYSMNVIRDGEESRLLLLARAIDLSDHGLGFLTGYPLRPSQVVSFEHGVLRETGVVAWSTMLDERTCRAGVRFA